MRPSSRPPILRWTIRCSLCRTVTAKACTSPTRRRRRLKCVSWAAAHRAWLSTIASRQCGRTTRASASPTIRKKCKGYRAAEATRSEKAAHANPDEGSQVRRYASQVAETDPQATAAKELYVRGRAAVPEPVPNYSSPRTVVLWGAPRPKYTPTRIPARVRSRDHNGKGKILIEYGAVEDFDRVVEALRGK